ncbi:hypothetical protein GCM10027601_01590 [Nocardioides ungokensis]
MMRRSLQGSACSLLLVSILALSGCTATQSAGGHEKAHGAGPLRLPDPHAWAQAISAGESFTDGLEVLRLRGAPSAVLTDVALVGDPAIELRGAMLVGPGREEGAIQVIDSWPPDDFELDESAMVEADGASISDDSAGSELLLGLRVKSAGTFDRVGIRIGYEVEGVQYTTFIPAFLRICATHGKPEPSYKCAAPSDWLDTEPATVDEFQTGPASGAS